jgi:hypothetical protein
LCGTMLKEEIISGLTKVWHQRLKGIIEHRPYKMCIYVDIDSFYWLFVSHY